MLRIITLVVGFAIYGVYSAAASFFGSAEPPVEQKKTKSALESFLTSDSSPSNLLTFDNAALAAGVPIEPLGDNLAGCSDSVVPPENVMALMATLPNEVKQPIAQLMQGSSALWTVQLYHGEKGTGLCLPTVHKVVILPLALPKIDVSATMQGLIGSFNK